MKKLLNFISYDESRSILLISASDIVCSHIYETYGDKAIKLIDKDLMDFITRIMSTHFAGKYMLINNYVRVKVGDVNYNLPITEERGLHCNLCYSNLRQSLLNKTYINSRLLGKGIDFDIYELKSNKLIKMDPLLVQSILKDYIELNGSAINMPTKFSQWTHISVLNKEQDPGFLGVDRSNYVEELPEVYLDSDTNLSSWIPGLPNISVGGQFYIPPSEIKFDEEGNYDSYPGIFDSHATTDYLGTYRELTPSEIASFKDIDCLDYLMKYNPGASRKDMEKIIINVSINIGCNPNWLMAVIMSESGGNPQADNAGIAVGLIQFTSIACKDLGTTKANIKSLTAYEQFSWINKYYTRDITFRNRRPKHPGDMYLATFAPAYIGKPWEFAIYRYPEKAYTQNPGFDLNRKGYISVGDVTNRIVNNAQKYKIRL